ncbi:hypothetical protein [Halobacillus karajensis]|uniref:Uncharacterized protein n=1 Tax=Halobacillus karajensis TaxID=195088 RepID=A0A059NW87_9BACI|nr:hypothetical protein [Halobacillus karajensis]CDQ22595.1 hypothetical protein BN983_00808 [Halobacillus karajensis]CDQ26077.1 hypothetical protein BN981_00288 [Halobacillus karajensis]
MTDRERMEIIEQLALVKGYNPTAFDRTSDEDLIKELNQLYGEAK